MMRGPAGLGLALLAERRFRNWGATKGECDAVLPGDELIPDPADVVTRVVRVDASADEVWRRLAQVGRRRGGVTLPATRTGAGPSIVLWQQPPLTPWEGICSLHVVPHGSHRCRLIARGRTARRGWLRSVAGRALDPISLVLTRRMLLDIKARAERSTVGVSSYPKGGRR